VVVGNGKYPYSHIRRHGRDSSNYRKLAWVEIEMVAMAPGTIQIASFSLHVFQSNLLPCNYETKPIYVMWKQPCSPARENLRKGKNILCEMC
jgi:hypothetical protein